MMKNTILKDNPQLKKLVTDYCRLDLMHRAIGHSMEVDDGVSIYDKLITDRNLINEKKDVVAALNQTFIVPKLEKFMEVNFGN